MSRNYLILFENDETGDIREIQKMYDIDLAKEIAKKYVKKGETSRVYTLSESYGNTEE